MAIEAGSSTYYQAKRGIVQDGLVLHLDAGVKESYSGGTTWRDLSGNGNNCTLINGASHIKNNGGKISLDGTNDWISTSFNPNVNNNRLVSFEMWFRDDSPGLSSSTNTALISNYGPSGTTPFLALHIRSNGTSYTYERNTSGQTASVSSSVVLADGNWKHIAATFGSTHMFLSINGTVQSNITRIGGTITSGQNLVIGGNHLGRYQSCDIAIVRIYLDKALGADEIRYNYNATRHRFGL